MSMMSGQSTPKSKIGGSFLSQSSYVLRGSPSKSRSKKRRITQLTLVKRGLFRVQDDFGIDRTPKLLYDPEYQVLEEWQPTVLDYVDADLASSGSQISLPRTLQQPSAFTYGSRPPHNTSMQMSSFTNIANVDSYKEATKIVESDIGSETRSEERSVEVAPSAFRLQDYPSREFYPPHSKVPLFAKETDSFTLFSLQSTIVREEDLDYVDVVKANESYEYNTIGEGKYMRKMTTSEQQTASTIFTSEGSLCPKIFTKNEATWVTLWKLYDEYLGISDDKKDTTAISIEDQWQQLVDDEKFFNQILIMERILGGSTFREIQLTYKKNLSSDPLDMEVEFTYSAKILWEYETKFTQKKPVTTITLNTKFPDIIAVGYGKFYYQDVDKGYICIWNAKNPKNPERFYKFSSSVKCLDFATWTPNYLSAGFANGDLLVIDIASLKKKILYKKNSVACGTYDRIEFTRWCIYTDIFGKKEEKLIVTTGDGRIIQFRRRLDNLVPFQMMRISKTEGKVKGIDDLQKCEADEIQMLRFPAARAVMRYPNNYQFYLVSGEDGVIHKCSTNYFTQHVEAFLAHSGPVYAMKFSPFCSKIFLTCGADGAVRLWAWDIFEPLITLTTGPYAVEDAEWSPRNGTIIASISDTFLHLWDLRRKAHHPASTIEHPLKLKFTCVKFTETGENIMLGDMEGRIYVMALYGMPFEEKFKEDILAASIQKELIVKPKLLKALKKLGPPFHS